MSLSFADAQREQLDRAGYTVLSGALSRPDVDRLNAHLEALWEREGAAAGSENTYHEPDVRRLANLADKGDVFRPIFGHPDVLEAVRFVLGADVNLIMLNARDVLPSRRSVRQDYHTDTDPVWTSGLPDAQGYLACTAIWLLSDSNADNGATRIVPGSHRSGKLPQHIMADLAAPHPDEVVVPGAVGDVLVINGSCWHCGGANLSDASRRTVLAHYKRAKLPRAKHHYPSLSPEARATMTPEELRLLGVEA